MKKVYRKRKRNNYVYFSNISQKTKDVPKVKKVTIKNKAVQTVQEEKVKIEADDLISTGRYILFYFSTFFAYIFYSYIFIRRWNKIIYYFLKYLCCDYLISWSK